MGQVVSSIQTPHPVDTLLAALPVDPNAGELRRRGAGPEPQIGSAQHREPVETVLGIGLVIAQSRGPEVLVVGRERGPIVGKDHSKPEGANELGVGKMCDDHSGRPLPCGLRGTTSLGRDKLEFLAQEARCVTEHGERIAGAEKLQEGRAVLIGLCRSEMPASGEYGHGWGEWQVEENRAYWSSRCTVAGENAGRHTAMYSAPSGSGVL
jgi:hypothetical protein